MATKDALVVIFSRNSFYKRLHYLALATFTLCLIVILVLLLILIHIIRNPKGPLYFATDNVARLIPIIPVNVPNMSTDEVIDWTLSAVQATFNNDYVNYRAQFQRAQKFFTNYGWTNYMRALTASNNILALTERKMAVTTQVAAPPKIVAQGILSGAYAWKFQISMLAIYLLPPYDDKPGTTKLTNPLDVTVIVQRQPVLEGYRGLGIVQLVANIVTAPSTTPQEISATPTG